MGQNPDQFFIVEFVKYVNEYYESYPVYYFEAIRHQDFIRTILVTYEGDGEQISRMEELDFYGSDDSGIAGDNSPNINPLPEDLKRTTLHHLREDINHYFPLIPPHTSFSVSQFFALIFWYRR